MLLPLFNILCFLSNLRVKSPIPKIIEVNIFEGMVICKVYCFYYLIWYSTIKIKKKTITLRQYLEKRICYTLKNIFPSLSFL